MSNEDQEEHVKKDLCFKCHKPGHQSFECPTIKIKITTLEVKQDDDDESDDEPTKEVVPSISTAAMNMEVEQEPTVLRIKRFINSTFLSLILIDSSSTHNMMLVSLAHKIGLPLISIKPYCSMVAKQPTKLYYSPSVERSCKHSRREHMQILKFLMEQDMR